MLNLETTINGKNYVRVTKAKAWNHYIEHTLFNRENGKIYMYPCNANQQSMWISPCELDYNQNFDHEVNAFELFNCNNELGRYAMFFIEK